MKASSTTSGGNILLVANYASDVGYAWWLMENFWSEIARYFELKNKKCFLIYPKINSIPEIIASSPIELIEIDFTNHSPQNIRKLKNLIQSNNIKNIYLTDSATHNPIYFKMRLWGARKIVNHDHTPGERPPARIVVCAIKKLIHILGLISCDHYIGVSKFVKDRFISNGCIPEKKCSYVLNGIIPIKKEVRCHDYANKEFSIHPNRTIVVTTGRAVFYKGIDFIIKCANEIVHTHNVKNISFLYCGDGPNINNFKEMVKKYNLQDNFIFAGQRNDIKCILQSCHIGIQASKGEAFSLSILEYLSAGLPTLVPDICGNSEAVKTAYNGYLYPAENKEEAVGLLLKLIKNKELRTSLGTTAIQSIEKQFNIKRTNQLLLQKLEEIFM